MRRFVVLAGLLLPSAVIVSALSFALLDADPHVTLHVDMDLGIPGNDVAQVYWVRSGGGSNPAGTFRAEEAAGFAVHPGEGDYQVDVPADLQALRIDPISQPGTIGIRRIAITAARIPLYRWDAHRRFEGWTAASDLADVETSGDLLRMRATGADPQIVRWGLGLAEKRRRIHLLMALAAAIVWMGFQGALLVFAGWRAGARVRADSAEGASGERSSSRAGIAVSVLATLLSAAAAYFLYARFISLDAEPRAPVADEGYELTLVDRWGRPLSEKPGVLKLVIDPFTLYRNYPGQQTRNFTINERGWRGAVTSDAGAPRAVVLGGSVAFGQGLASDEETFASQLNQMSSDRQFINAAVVGFLSGQELAEMVHYADAVRPNLYVVLDGWNDAYVQSFPGAGADEFGYNWHVFDELEERLHRHATDGLSPRSRDRSERERPQWKDPALQEKITGTYFENLRRMVSFAAARGAALLVVFQPQLSDKQHLTDAEAPILESWRTTYSATHAELARRYQHLVDRARVYCAEQGIAYLDLTPAFRGDLRTLFADAIHPNKAGHRLIAEQVLEWVKALPAPGSPSGAAAK